VPKTYNTFTNVSTGDVLTATNFNNVLTNIGNYRVPPACTVRRTSNLTSYTSGAAITWNEAAWDTESPSDPMWAAGSPTVITIRTAGIYVVTFAGYCGGSATITLAYPAISVNGTVIQTQYSVINGGAASMFSMSTTLSLAATNTVSANVSFVGGSAYLIYGNSTLADTQTRLCVTWLGQAS
jgi:hypothetical protein